MNQFSRLLIYICCILIITGCAATAPENVEIKTMSEAEARFRKNMNIYAQVVGSAKVDKSDPDVQAANRGLALVIRFPVNKQYYYLNNEEYPLSTISYIPKGVPRELEVSVGSDGMKFTGMIGRYLYGLDYEDVSLELPLTPKAIFVGKLGIRGDKWFLVFDDNQVICIDCDINQSVHDPFPAIIDEYSYSNERLTDLKSIDEILPFPISKDEKKKMEISKMSREGLFKNYRSPIARIYGDLDSIPDFNKERKIIFAERNRVRVYAYNITPKDFPIFDAYIRHTFLVYPIHIKR